MTEIDEYCGMRIREVEALGSTTMTQLLYADDNPPQRWWRVRRWRQRVSDAWAVLRGKAFID